MQMVALLTSNFISISKTRFDLNSVTNIENNQIFQRDRITIIGVKRGILHGVVYQSPDLMSVLS